MSATTQPSDAARLALAKSIAAAYAPPWLAGLIRLAPRGKIPVDRGWQRVRERRAQPDGGPCDVARVAVEIADHLRAGGNVGLTPPEGVAILDADTAESAAKLDALFTDAPLQRTARGGHVVVRLPPGALPLRNAVEVDLGGYAVDVRSVGAQIVVAPSVHASGHTYRWERPLPGTVEELPVMPASMVEALRKARAPEPTLRLVAAGDGAIPKGRRNDELFREGCRLRRDDFGEASILARLAEINAARCSPPLDDGEVASVAASVMRYEPEQRAPIPEDDRRNEPPPIDERHAPPPIDERHAPAPTKPWYGKGRPPLLVEGAPTTVDPATIGFTGESLSALEDEVIPPAPVDGLFDPEPCLMVAVAKPKTAKTSVALHFGRCFAEGTAPWSGERAVPQGDVLYISGEQSARMLWNTAKRMYDGAKAHGGFEMNGTWLDHTTFVAKSPNLSPEARKLLRLDTEGLGVLRGVLAAKRVAGRPIRFLVVDSLSRCKPHGYDEQSNNDMTEFEDALAAIATEFAVWILLIHHTGHTIEESRGEARSAGRGASAIEAVPQVNWLIERVKDQKRQISIAVDGNSVYSKTWFFETARPDDPERAVLYMLPVEPLAAYEITNYVQPGESVVQRELAFRIGEFRMGNLKPATRPGSPNGGDVKIAKALAEQWIANGKATGTPGRGKSTTIELLDPDGTPPAVAGKAQRRFTVRGAGEGTKRKLAKPPVRRSPVGPKTPKEAT